MINLYKDRPDLYDLLHDGQGEDLPFYLVLLNGLCGPECDVLELGCGTGRVLEALLDDGFHATGLDAERRMLERARARLKGSTRLRLLQGEMMDPPCADAVYDAVIVAANTFMHLADHEEQRRCLGAIKRVLRPEGLAILDLANPFYLLHLPQGVVTPRRRGRAGEVNVEVTGILEVEPTYPQARDYLVIDEWVAGEPLRRSVAELLLRLVFMPELELLLASVGLGIADAYGDYALGPYDKDAERMIVVVRPYEAMTPATGDR